MDPTKEKLIYFKRNTPQLAAAGIKGMRIQFSDVSDYLIPSSCGGALHAPQLAARVRRRRLTKLAVENNNYTIGWDLYPKRTCCYYFADISLRSSVWADDGKRLV